MLDDRSYMRTPRREYWSMTTILLVTLASCYLVQMLLEKSLGPRRVDEVFALSLAGLKAGRIYQLLTFQFMHGGLWHLLGNMIGVYFFGNAIEQMFGSKGMLKLYLMSGTVGGLIYIVFALIFPQFDIPVVGASAGVFGLIAAFATRAPDELISMFLFPFPFRAKVFLLIEAVITVGGIVLPLLGVIPLSNTAHGAHLGGMLTGIAYAKWANRLDGVWGFWRPTIRRRQARSPVSGSPPRTMRRPRKKAEELPPAEFISREVDPILEKISAQGIHSLTDRERQILEAARSKMARK